MSDYLYEIKKLLESHLESSNVDVVDLTGTQDHLDLNIKWQGFEGKGLIEQHQIVMDILKDELKNKLHAVKIKTSY